MNQYSGDSDRSGGLVVEPGRSVTIKIYITFTLCTNIGLILITLMYFNYASNTRNIPVSDRDSVSAETQYGFRSGAQKNLIGTFLIDIDQICQICIFPCMKSQRMRRTCKRAC